MEITYKWKTAALAKSAASFIAWNMPHIGMPEIIRKGRKITFNSPYDYVMNRIFHFVPECGGNVVEKSPRLSK